MNADVNSNVKFEIALHKAQDLARASHKELTGLMYSLITENWTAYFSDAEGYSYVEIRNQSSAELLTEIDTNYAMNNPFSKRIRSIRDFVRGLL